MTRIQKTLAALKAQNKKALIPYVMAGDPDPSWTVELMLQLAQNGADIIELGLPFSDPMADGEAIAQAGERALALGVGVRQAARMVGEFRKRDQKTPVLLMGYLNPVEIIGYDRFLDLCAENGVDGLLLVDLPPNEADEALTQKMADRAIDPIFLLAPTTTPERQREILRRGSGFVYYVSLKGVTGAANLDVSQVRDRVAAIKAQSDTPICVGFGVRDAATAASLASVADGVIVGSALVRHFADVGGDRQKQTCAVEAVVDTVRQLRAAIDAP